VRFDVDILIVLMKDTILVPFEHLVEAMYHTLLDIYPPFLEQGTENVQMSRDFWPKFESKPMHVLAQLSNQLRVEELSPEQVEQARREWATSTPTLSLKNQYKSTVRGKQSTMEVLEDGTLLPIDTTKPSAETPRSRRVRKRKVAEKSWGEYSSSTREHPVEAVRGEVGTPGKVVLPFSEPQGRTDVWRGLEVKTYRTREVQANDDVDKFFAWIEALGENRNGLRTQINNQLDTKADDVFGYLSYDTTTERSRSSEVKAHTTQSNEVKLDWDRKSSEHLIADNDETSYALSEQHVQSNLSKRDWTRDHNDELDVVREIDEKGAVVAEPKLDWNPNQPQIDPYDATNAVAEETFGLSPEVKVHWNPDRNEFTSTNAIHGGPSERSTEVNLDWNPDQSEFNETNAIHEGPSERSTEVNLDWNPDQSEFNETNAIHEGPSERSTEVNLDWNPDQSEFNETNAIHERPSERSTEVNLDWNPDQSEFNETNAIHEGPSSRLTETKLDWNPDQSEFDSEDVDESSQEVLPQGDVNSDWRPSDDLKDDTPRQGGGTI
jgi:hypothetical protein